MKNTPSQIALKLIIAVVAGVIVALIAHVAHAPNVVVAPLTGAVAGLIFVLLLNKKSSESPQVR